MIYLYHYYEKRKGPFINLSELSDEEAKRIQDDLRDEKKVFAGQRNEEYLARRKYLEQLVRDMFIKKGGRPERKTPYYMVIGECPWLATWYEEGTYIRIPVTDFDINTLSFTYGDTFPTFSDRVTDDYEFRRNVYTYDEILKIIDKYGLPQNDWKDPVFAQPAYVEVQVWSDDPISKYRK